ncbi:hypothetical protein BCR36DRAFT_461353 [Piromyces finnis]|uniref:Uncharacterized protein n=1 Tax=Piromyces finnis TaxID=1754191 RepID=A0A1Y1UYM7_9FUNG|nr:hypothetical protein BCR36DRAFT_444296 [Piromyces finnis]ORX42953.1 hypothetical protein BCR36DRAFT_461353 [Piromyces finnis]|eukprot:ORX36975.1 hypothetical protein BCR36DRAFT_444296 [Piromyces finnis]
MSAVVADIGRKAAPYINQAIRKYAKEQIVNAKYKLEQKYKQTQIDKAYKQDKPMAKKAKTKSKHTKVKGKKYKSRGFKVRRRRFKGRAINVKEDREGYSKTFKKQKVTKQQQRKINRRFKNGYSPFKECIEDAFQETILQVTGKCKWIWRCHNHLEYLSKTFANWPCYSGNPGTIPTYAKQDKYLTSPNQEVYFSQFKHTYEIYNPTNYDMNLVIYDIVAKQDSTDSVVNANYNYYNDPANSAHRNPIRCIELGLSAGNGQYTAYESSTTQYPIVADSTAKELHDITLGPTESYPFNIYWTIVKKRTFKLQPGATMVHKFIHKPKALVSRGYWGYRYGKDMKMGDGDSRRAIKDITSGCLFKYWGQVSGSAYSTGSGPTGDGQYVNMTQMHDQVTTLSGRIMFKEYIENKWYFMNERYTFTFKTDLNTYKPSDEEDLPVVNDAEVKPSTDADGTGMDTDNPVN